jgi:hypothetical protein
MLVKFKNAHPGREGDDLFINVNHVKCVYEDSTPTLQTKISGPDVTWTVEEGMTEVFNMINDVIRKQS